MFCFDSMWLYVYKFFIHVRSSERFWWTASFRVKSGESNKHSGGGRKYINQDDLLLLISFSYLNDFFMDNGALRTESAEVFCIFFVCSYLPQTWEIKEHRFQLRTHKSTPCRVCPSVCLSVIFFEMWTFYCHSAPRFVFGESTKSWQMKSNVLVEKSRHSKWLRSWLLSIFKIKPVDLILQTHVWHKGTGDPMSSTIF